jgi:hypothetical protein
MNASDPIYAAAQQEMDSALIYGIGTAALHSRREHRAPPLSRMRYWTCSLAIPVTLSLFNPLPAGLPDSPTSRIGPLACIFAPNSKLTFWR